MIIIYKGVKVYSSKDSLFNPMGLLIQICNIWCGHCPSPDQTTILFVDVLMAVAAAAGVVSGGAAGLPQR